MSIFGISSKYFNTRICYQNSVFELCRPERERDGKKSYMKNEKFKNDNNVCLHWNELTDNTRLNIHWRNNKDVRVAFPHQYSQDIF